MRQAKDPRVLEADAQGGGRAQAREPRMHTHEPNSAPQPSAPEPSAPSPSHLDAPPSDPDMIDMEDQAELCMIVNEGLDMQENGRDLIHENEEEIGADQ